MAMRPGRRSGRTADRESSGAATQAAAAQAILSGPAPDGSSRPAAEAAARETRADIVRTIARRVSSAHARLTGGSTLETMARLTTDSLLSTPVKEDWGLASPGTKMGASRLKDALDKVDATLINDIFLAEKRRLDDYVTFEQIAELITQAAEAIQSFCDNIISPDDFTKRDISAFHIGAEAQDKDTSALLQERMRHLVERYKLDDRIEEAILGSLTKGDFFIAVLNLRQELEGVLTEGASLPSLPKPVLFNEHHVPEALDPDLSLLCESLREPVTDRSHLGPAPEPTVVRKAVSDLLNSLVTFNETSEPLAAKTAKAASTFANDLDWKRYTSGSRADGATPAKKKPSLAKTAIRGSIVKLIPPENVVKLYQDDTLFGYYFIEVSGVHTADFGRANAEDQTAVVRALDQNLASRAFGVNTGTNPESARERIINRIIVRTLAARLGKADFLADNEQFATDAYAILSRAKRAGKRVTITYVAPDQMVHFTPTGASGYGDSVLARVKFIAKLYIGAITNAFMRNSIRRPEKLVWYLDVGLDNDPTNVVQTFIRTIRQNEIKFSNLRDITTTLNHIGEFHDFFIPTYNGERPVEVETLNMGGGGEVDSDFLEYLRKNIIAGMGVPAAFLGYSEEVAFARSLSMDNGRFLRRVVRYQKHFGRAATAVVRALWRNEYSTLEELIGPERRGSASEEQPAAARDPHRNLTYNEDAGSRAASGAVAGGGSETESPPTKAAGEDKVGKDVADDAAKKDILDSEIEVRFPSPATLNMNNLADAINQATPIVDYIVETVAGAEDDPTKAAFKGSVARDTLPQLPWDRYDSMLEEARKVGLRAKNTAVGVAAPGAEGGSETPGGEMPGGEAPGGEMPGGEAPGGEMPGGEAPGGEMPGGEAPGGEMPGGEAPTE